MPYQSVEHSINGMETKTIEVVMSMLVAEGIAIAFLAAVLGVSKMVGVLSLKSLVIVAHRVG
jgi:hypothetical protein